MSPLPLQGSPRCRNKAEIAALVDDFASMGLGVQAATEDGSLGKQGLVTDLMLPLENENPVMVYACGPYPMLRAVVGSVPGQRLGLPGIT